MELSAVFCCYPPTVACVMHAEYLVNLIVTVSQLPFGIHSFCAALPSRGACKQRVKWRSSCTCMLCTWFSSDSHSARITAASPVAVETAASPVAVETAASPVAVEMAASPVAVETARQYGWLMMLGIHAHTMLHPRSFPSNTSFFLIPDE